MKLFALSIFLLTAAPIFSAAGSSKKKPLIKQYIEALEAGQAGTDLALKIAQNFAKTHQHNCVLNGSTPLGWAALHGNHAVAEYLCTIGADVDQRQRSESTALHDAASCGSAETIAILLGYGANPQLKNTSGATPLHKALISKHSVAAIMLINAGSPTDAQDNFGNTPLSLAQANGLRDVVAKLTRK